MTSPNLDDGRSLSYAQTLISLGRYAEAVPYLVSVLAHDPGLARGWCMLAHVKLELKDLSVAIDAASRASAIEPDNEWALRLIAICQQRQGRHATAAKTARRAVAAAPNFAAAHTVLASCLTGTSFGRGEATREAALAVSIAPMDPSTHICQANVAISRRQWSVATDAVGRALELDPTNSRALQARARLQARRMVAPTWLADSAGSYADTLRLDPTTQQARSNLDLTLTVFLNRLGYLLFIETWILFRIASNASAAGRLLPVIGLAAPATFAYLFTKRLPPALRSYLLTHITRSRVRIPVTFTALAAFLLLATSVAPSHTRSGLLAAALGSALIGRFAVALQVERYRLGRSETFSTSMVVLLGVAAAAAGGLFIAAINTTDATAVSLVPIALACWAAAGACGYVVWRRRAASTRGR